jgi:hypothetical protein
MKKNYINPEMQIVKLAYRKPVLLTASTETLGGEADSKTKGMAREFDFFDE